MPEGQVLAPIDEGVFLLHRNKGKELFQRQKLEEALGELEAARRMRPEDEQVLNLLGMVYFRQNMLEDAKAVYEALIERNPSVYSLRSNLGLIYLKQNRYAEAEKHFVEAVEIEPGNAKARQYLGLICEKQFKYAEALAQYRLAGNDRMVRQIEQLLRMLAERGEPLPAATPAPETAPAAPAPAPSEPTEEALPHGAAVRPEVIPPVPHRPEALPESPAEGPVAAVREVQPPALPELTQVFDIRKALKAEQAEPAPAPAAEELIRPAPADEVVAKAEIETAITMVAGRPIPPKQEPVEAPAVARTMPLNLAVLTQPSLPHLKLEGDEFRIVNKSYLEVDFKRGLVANAQRLIGGTGVVKTDAYVGVDGLLEYANGGRLLAYEDHFRIHLLRLTDEYFFVKPGYVIALQPSLKVHWADSVLFRLLRIQGDGIVALAISTGPIVFDIAQAPLLVDASYLAAISAVEPIQLTPSSRPGFVELNGQGSAMLFPAGKM
ncbi:MAG: tetratricopeptide repeat protein [Acidobacteriota bacterium]